MDLSEISIKNVNLTEVDKTGYCEEEGGIGGSGMECYGYIMRDVFSSSPFQKWNVSYF
jgi:hypothetical protein